VADFPSCYDPDRIGTLFYPDVAALAQEAARAGLPPASQDQQRIQLLIIDMQVDFCHPQGTLHVPGAVQDIRRLVEFIYRNAGRISSITCSLDSHLPYIGQGKWRPLLEPEWSTAYVQKLEEGAKKQLTIWPYHVPIGGIGNALDPELWSAVFWHAIARKSQPTWWRKGSVPKTEHYSIVQPEIPVPEVPEGERRSFLEDLEKGGAIIIAGEAASHCVLETLEDLVDEFADRPETLGKFFILRDCTSPVQHPDIDFAALTEKRFSAFEKQGIHFILSTDPLPF